MNIGNIGATDYSAGTEKGKRSVPQENDRSVSTDEMTFEQAVSEKKEEIYQKIMSGDTEQSFAIGAQSFTLKEWDKLLARFDKAEDKIKEAQKEEMEKRAEQSQNKADDSREKEYGNIFPISHIMNKTTK